MCIEQLRRFFPTDSDCFGPFIIFYRYIYQKKVMKVQTDSHTFKNVEETPSQENKQWPEYYPKQNN